MWSWSPPLLARQTPVFEIAGDEPDPKVIPSGLILRSAGSWWEVVGLTMQSMAGPDCRQPALSVAASPLGRS